MRVYITSDVEHKLWFYVASVKTEIGGMGYARILEDGDILWQDVFLCPQLVSGSEVDFEATDGDAYAVEKAARDGVLSDPQFVWVSWHSHASMNTFWSSTDDDRIKAWRACDVKHLLSVVVNKDHKFRCRYDAFNIDHHGCAIAQVTMDNLALYDDPADEYYAARQAEVDSMVKEAPKPVQRPYSSGVGQSRGWISSSSSPSSSTSSDADDDASDYLIDPGEGLGDMTEAERQLLEKALEDAGL